MRIIRVLLVTGVMLGAPVIFAQNTGQAGGHTMRMYQVLEDAASKANGLDRNSVSNLVDGVFTYPTLATLP